MKILYILKHDPWGIGGGCYACRNYLEAFYELFKGSEIEILVCAEYLVHGKMGELPNVHFIGVNERKLVNKLLSPVTGEMHRFQSVATKLLKANHYDWCIFDHNCIAGSLVKLCKKQAVKTVVLNHNCEFEYYRDNHPSLLNRMLFLPVVKQNERKAYLLCDYNLFLTKEDRELFGQLYGISTTVTVIGGCFLKKGERIETTVLKPFNKQKLKVVISGTIGNVQNLDGINYFLNELYPCVLKDMDVVIAGKNPPAELVERLKEFGNIELIADPRDMDAVLRDCDIFLCPTRLGGGMKLRVMDGLRNGLPVIAHKVSARGYSAFYETGCLKAFKDKEDFEKILIKLIEDIKSSRINKEDIVAHTIEELSFETAVVNLKAIKMF